MSLKLIDAWAAVRFYQRRSSFAEPSKYLDTWLCITYTFDFVVLVCMDWLEVGMLM